MKKLGVVVARFQVPHLHEGHRYLLEQASKESDVLLVLLGYKVNQPDSKNPLSLSVRKGMLRQTLASIDGIGPYIVGEIEDNPISNEAWSEDLDEIITEHVRTLEAGDQDQVEVCLYGSRDSFIKYYHGIFNHVTLDEKGTISGTEVRKAIVLLPQYLYLYLVSCYFF